MSAAAREPRSKSISSERNVPRTQTFGKQQRSSEFNLISFNLKTMRVPSVRHRIYPSAIQQTCFKFNLHI